jgi:hypothetical protein
MHARLTAATALAALAPALAAVAVAAPPPRELHRSTGPENTTFARLARGTTYRAGLVGPLLTVTPQVAGWTGAQFVTHQHGKPRYAWAAFLWQHQPGGDIAIISGPALTGSAADVLARPRAQFAKRGIAWPYGAPRRWRIAGRTAYYYDGTNPGPVEFTILGSNPPEDSVGIGQSFRLAALDIRGRTVVIVLQTPPGEPVSAFLPIASRLLSTLRVPAA